MRSNKCILIASRHRKSYRRKDRVYNRNAMVQEQTDKEVKEQSLNQLVKDALAGVRLGSMVATSNNFQISIRAPQ